MKKTMLAGAVLAGFSGIAAAQSSVTLFGVIDVAARSVKNGSVGTVQSMVSGSNSTGRWGLRGGEDLGNGLKAEFWLESEVAVDTGEGGAPFWGRRSTVSLNSSSMGELRLGRDYVPTHNAACAIDVFGCVGLASINTFRATQAAVFTAAGGRDFASRANNSIAYFTPNTLGGFFATVFVSAGEGALSNGTEQVKGQGARIGYTAGPVNVQVATFQAKNMTAAIPTFKDTVIGGAYDFGIARVGLERRMFTFGADKLTSTALNASAPVGRGTVKLQYIKGDQSSSNATTNANDASLVGIGYQYDLSKRTAIYTTAARISNKNLAVFRQSGGPAVTTANFGGQKSTGYELGLRHSF